VTMKLCPTTADRGIVLQRTDSTKNLEIAALATNVSSTDLCTTIGKGDDSVATTEHLLATFVGLQVDNVLVKIDGPEVPILDGSAAPFVDIIEAAGIAKLPQPAKILRVKKPLEVTMGDRSMRVDPADELSFDCIVEYPWRAVGRQELKITLTPQTFREVCRARTFCHQKEVDAMRKMGLALGGSLDNAIVVTDDGFLNEGGLRMHDEFVRHKILDCIGDLALLGAPLVGKITIRKAGHGLHALFIRTLIEKRDEHLEAIS